MSANHLSGAEKKPKRTWPYLVALLFSAGFIAACFAFKAWAWWRLKCCWVYEEPKWAFLALHIAEVWNKSWWLFSPFIVILFLVCAYFHEMVREIRSR